MEFITNAWGHINVLMQMFCIDEMYKQADSPKGHVASPRNLLQEALKL